MRTIKLMILSLLATLLLLNESSAQRDVYNWQVSPYGGLLTLSKDIATPSDANYFAYGMRLERRLGNAFTLGLHLFQARLQGAGNENLSGSFLSLGYHWDNGYLFSQRSFISIFHRIDLGYTNPYSQIDNINSKNGDLTFGFENGLKFRFGDRITAEVALEILGTESSFTEGEIAQNDRFNVWKVGLNYHFGGRKSDFVSPVFVPDAQISAPVKAEKVEKKDKFSSILVLPDTSESDREVGALRDSLLVDTTKAVSQNPKLSRADSLKIFMYFDSLYQRRSEPDTLGSRADTSYFQNNTGSMRDSTVISDSLAIQDASRMRDSTIVERDSVPVNQINVSNDSIISRVDTVNLDKPVSPLQADTVYIDTPAPAEQKADTSAAKSNLKSVDESTLIIAGDDEDNEESAEKEKEDSKKDIEKKNVSDNSNTDALQSSVDNQNKLLAQQNKDIQKNRQEIAKLNSQNNKGDVGKIIAAGAAGTILGAVISKDKNKTDTVYYESAAAQEELNRLEAELAVLKLQYGIADSTAIVDSIAIVDSTAVIDSAYVADPPIGSYFENDSLNTDSTITAGIDTLIIPAVPDTILEADSTAVPKKAPADSTLNEVADTSAVVSPISISDEPEGIDSLQTTEELPEGPSQSTASLKGNYPLVCNFGLNKTSLDADELQKLDVVVEDLKNDESRSVLLTGYTDKSGNADYNLKLSKQRATSVMDYLISKGITKEKIEIKGGGISEGAGKFEPNSRRVEVTIREK